MLKRILFVAILALQAGAVVSVASASQPYPVCLPCPDGGR
jgi:hypothetical protein